MVRLSQMHSGASMTGVKKCWIGVDAGWQWDGLMSLTHDVAAAKSSPPSSSFLDHLCLDWKYMKASKQLTLVTEVPHLIPGVKEGWQWHNGHLRMMSLLPSHQHCCYPHHPLLPCIFCHCRGRFYSAIHPALDDYSKAQLIRFWLSSCSVKCMQCNAVQQQCIWTTCVLIILCNRRLVQVWTSYLVL